MTGKNNLIVLMKYSPSYDSRAKIPGFSIGDHVWLYIYNPVCRKKHSPRALLQPVDSFYHSWDMVFMYYNQSGDDDCTSLADKTNKLVLTKMFHDYKLCTGISLCQAY